MIALPYFEDEAGEARRILDAMSRLASARTGHACVFELAPSLDDAKAERVLQLQAEAFGGADVAFTRRDLSEVTADPDALFLTLHVDGEFAGCAFGYWEWPDQITVPGTDFFLDSAMVAAPYRGRGIGKLAVAGLLLLADLLECQRVGIAAWLRGPRGRGLIRFYRRFGFARVGGAPGPHAQMAVSLDDAKVARWRIELELAPDGDRLPVPGRVWPRADERRLAGRFYAAMGLAEGLYFVAPFEFAYLYLTMSRPDWAVYAMAAGAVAAMAAALPSGVWADRWSRKRVVMIGGALIAVGLTAVPFAVSAPGAAELAATCAAFAVMGAGQTLMMGSAEAWVVDNLHAAGRPDLIETFYGRVRSVSAAGAAVAAAGAFLLLLATAVSQSLLDALWLTGAVGFALAVIVAARVPERRVEGEAAVSGPALPGVRDALRALAGRRALIMIGVAIILGAAAGAAAQQAFTVALITEGFDARMFAPLSIVDSLIGAIGPIIGIAFARRIGARHTLVLGLALEALAVGILFVSSGVGALVAVYVMLDLFDDAWDPVALARLQSLTPSAHRATISALVYQLGAAAEFAALGAFALMLGRHRQALEAATPDLLEAFSGKAPPPPALPAVWLGLPLPDLAIVLFVLLGAAAIPFVMATGDGAERVTGRPRSAPAPR
ncbi:MAG: MFS transporter [Gemmatimonadota bacterium]|nr:MFS transporter [Gemmatimonadota bacterium]